MDLTPIISAGIGLITAVAIVILVPKVKAALNAILTSEQQAQLAATIKIAVQAAEQIYQNMPKSGAAKKDYVLNYLEKKGYLIDTEEINAQIEAAVNQLFGK